MKRQTRPPAHATRNAVVHYYSRPTTRLGYNVVMRGSKHFGYYDDTHTTERAAQERFLEKVVSMLGLRSGQHVLDAGCGQGVIAAYVASKADVHLTGITLVPFETKSAARRAKRCGVSRRTSFILGDYTEPPFAPASFDRIYAVETLSHVPDVQKALNVFYSLLKPGGKLVCVEYELDYANGTEQDMREGEFLIKAGALHGGKQFGSNEFPGRLTKAGFSNITEEDWTPHMLPSFQRLRRLAAPFKPLLKVVGLKPWLINAHAASKYADWTERGLFKFKAYTAQKRA